MATSALIKPKSSHPLYPTWSGMLQRCNNPKGASYDHYGGRGIKVCDRWLGLKGFGNFILDMGEKSLAGDSLDRIDSTKGYSPDNCRWANKRIQSLNKVPHKNNSLGVSGVEKLPSGKYRARTNLSGRRIHLGVFSTIAEASRVYRDYINNVILAETVN